jgi:hypothetical protein
MEDCGLLTFNNFLALAFCNHDLCHTPTLAKCGGEAQHLEKSGVGVLRDSRMFRAQQQGPKLWAKEGPGVKLAV